MKKYPHIIELLACTVKIFGLMFLCPTSSLISLGTYVAPKLSKKNYHFFCKTKQSNVFQYLQVPSFILLGKLSLEKNTIHSIFILVILLYLRWH